jgi:hypothetical protein
LLKILLLFLLDSLALNFAVNLNYVDRYVSKSTAHQA